MLDSLWWQHPKARWCCGGWSSGKPLGCPAPSGQAQTHQVLISHGAELLGHLPAHLFQPHHAVARLHQHPSTPLLSQELPRSRSKVVLASTTSLEVPFPKSPEQAGRVRAVPGVPHCPPRLSPLAGPTMVLEIFPLKCQSSPLSPIPPMAFRILTAPLFPPVAPGLPNFSPMASGPPVAPPFPPGSRGFPAGPREWEAGRGTWGHERGSEGQEQGGTSACMREREGNKVCIPCFTTQTALSSPSPSSQRFAMRCRQCVHGGGVFLGAPPASCDREGGVAAWSLLVQERCEGLGHADEPRGLLADPLVVPPAR